MTVLVLSQAHAGIIRREAEAALPCECCGLLIGQGSEIVTVTNIVVAENQADSADRFLIDPQVQFDWLRKLRGSEERIVGHYHSHPNGRCDPSAHDADMAQDPDQIWIIIPVDNGHPGDIGAFKAGPKRGDFLPVTLKDA